MQNQCSIPDCTGPYYGRNLCNAHYLRFWRRRQLDRFPKPTVLQRFFSYVVITDGCWFWRGGMSGRRGQRYGTFNINSTGVMAHRFLYEQLVGPIPEGLTLDHLCRNTACVNPDHLEPVTNRENGLRGFTVAAVNARKTHCPEGHPYDHIYKRPTGQARGCKQCLKVSRHNTYLRRRDRRQLESTP